MSRRLLLGCLCLSLALHGLLLLLFRDSPWQPANLRQTLRVERLLPALPAPAAPVPNEPPPLRPPQKPLPPKALPPLPPPPPVPEPQPPETEPAPKAEMQPELPPNPPSAPSGQRDFASEAVVSPEPVQQASSPVPAGEVLPPTPGTTGSVGTARSDSEPYQPPTYLSTPKPDYPRLARRRHWEGTVLLKVFIDDRGRVGRAQIDRSSGHEILDQAAMRQITGWRFRPARRGGSAVGGEALIPVVFVLDGT